MAFSSRQSQPDASSQAADGSSSPAASQRPRRSRTLCANLLVLITGLVLLFVTELLNGRNLVHAQDVPLLAWEHLPDFIINLFVHPVLAALNYAVILCILWALVLLFGRWIAGTILCALLVVAFACANQQKQEMLHEPIVWQDILILGDTLKVLKAFITPTYLLLLLAGVPLVLITTLLDGVFRLPRIRLRLRLLGFVVALAFPVAIASLPGTAAGRYIGEPALNSPNTDYQAALSSFSRSHGLLLALAFSRGNTELSEPADYTEQTVTAVASEYVQDTPPSSQKVKPHVVAVMMESFWDVTQLPNVTIVPDPLQTIHHLPGNGQTFRTLSPVIGRPTANVEFEFLTGMSMYFLPTGSIPYLEFVNHPLPALPNLFVHHGYRALAIHPYTCEFWDRNKVYPQLGFQKFEDIVAFMPQDVKGNYVSDDVLASHIIHCIDSAKQPTFLFAVSMQNHAPHTRSQYSSYDIHLTSQHAPGLNEDTLVAYAQGCYDTDHAIRRLIDHFSQSKEPVVLVVFGDHLPPLSNVYAPTGYQRLERENDPDQRLALRATPGLIWTNMPGKLPKLPPVLSPNFITPSLLEYIGISDPYFTELLGDGQRACPGLSRFVCADVEGKTFLAQPDGCRRFLYDYDLIQHDLLFGYEYSIPWLAPRGSGATVPRSDY